jgi:hypothetical protein
MDEIEITCWICRIYVLGYPEGGSQRVRNTLVQTPKSAMLMARENRKYAFYMEGYDPKDEVYGKTLLDTGSTEWFSVLRE